MQRSAAISMLAVELGILPADKAGEVMDRFHASPSYASGERFELWAVANNVLPLDQARHLREAFIETPWQCMKCRAVTLAKDLAGRTELRCPKCQNIWFQRVLMEDTEQDTPIVPGFDAAAAGHGTAGSEVTHLDLTTHGADVDDTYVDEPASATAIRKTASAAGDVLHAGQRLGNWEILEVAGRGGMSTVYKARHPELGQFAAIKVLDPDYLGSATQRLRFRDEARVCASIEHPNIIDVLDFSEIAGHIYIIIQWIDGDTLDRVLRKRGPLKVAEVLDIGIQACQGLAAAHRAGVIHRDIKPENLMLRRADGRVKITDFGLAKSVHAEVGRTQPGFFVGTPSYMAPEQVNSEPVSPQTDIYSLGATLFHLLTGRKPFTAPKVMQVMQQHVADPFPSAREIVDSVPASLDQLLKWMCAKQAGNRPESCEQIARLLEDIREETVHGRSAAVPMSPVPDDDGGRPEMATVLISPSTPEAESELLDELGSMLKRLAYPADFASRAEFVVSELVAHARSKPGAKDGSGNNSRATIRVVLRLTREWLKVTVEDDGPEFDADEKLARIPASSTQDQLASGDRLAQIRELSDYLEFDVGGRRATALLKARRLRLTQRQPVVKGSGGVTSDGGVEIVEVNGNLDSRNQLGF
ncbi:MAG: serine/threonine protein kinase [Planctomycetota bacterium]